MSWIVELARVVMPGGAELILRVPWPRWRPRAPRAGDRLVMEPRPDGLWLGRAPGA